MIAIMILMVLGYFGDRIPQILFQIFLESHNKKEKVFFWKCRFAHILFCSFVIRALALDIPVFNLKDAFFHFLLQILAQEENEIDN